MYTFELKFLGLCLFLFNSDQSVDVNLINATESRNSACESTVTLPAHEPILSFNLDEVLVEFSGDDLEDMRCESTPLPEKRCSLQGLELELQLVTVDLGGNEHPFTRDFRPVYRGRDQDDHLPGPGQLDGLEWFAHLGRIDTEAPELKDGVKDGFDGNLLSSRIKIDEGELFTSELGYQPSRGMVPWDLEPDDRQRTPPDHPKALSESISLSIRRLSEQARVKLVSNSGEYWWRFGPKVAQQPVSIRISNLPPTQYKTAAVGSEEDYRLRHFLWYWELFKWPADCSVKLVAPECPGPRRDCWKGQRQTRLMSRQDIVAGNQFCPPATWP